MHYQLHKDDMLVLFEVILSNHLNIYIYIYIYIVCYIYKWRVLSTSDRVWISLNNIDTESVVFGNGLLLAYAIIRLYIYIYIYIYIYCHPQTDCFIVPQLFSVARHVGCLKLGSKPAELYVRLSIKLLGQQAREL